GGAAGLWVQSAGTGRWGFSGHVEPDRTRGRAGAGARGRGGRCNRSGRGPVKGNGGLRALKCNIDGPSCTSGRAVERGAAFGYKPAMLLTFLKPSGGSEPMTVWMRGSLSAVGVAAIAVVLAACQSTGSNTANLNTIGAPAQLQAVPNSTVQQGTLPAIGATGTPAPGLSGQPVLGGVSSQTAMATPGTTTPGATPSIVSLDPLAQPVAGGMSTGPEGAWNVV